MLIFDYVYELYFLERAPAEVEALKVLKRLDKKDTDVNLCQGFSVLRFFIISSFTRCSFILRSCLSYMLPEYRDVNGY